MTYAQIADALDIAPKTVENQMGKALRMLRVALAAWLPGHDNE
jgi:RNA polymerase sigma-70 factor, ECF subfamily